MEIVVSDTSPILGLHQVGRLHLLWSLCERVLVPPAVASELQTPPGNLKPIGAAELSRLQQMTPLDRSLVARVAQELDTGESEAIALAIERRIEHILLDEQKGRRLAVTLGLQPIGLLGLLILAKRKGLLEAVAPVVHELRTQHGFFLADSIVQQVLRSVGEEG